MRDLDGEMKKDPASSNTTPRQSRSNVVPLKGEIDLHVSPTLTAALNHVVDKKPERLVVDLSDVSYIDSAGLAALIQAMQKVEGYGGKFMLAGLQETVRSIFAIVRLDQVFQIFPDADAALVGEGRSRSNGCPAVKQQSTAAQAVVSW